MWNGILNKDFVLLTLSVSTRQLDLKEYETQFSESILDTPANLILKEKLHGKK